MAHYQLVQKHVRHAYTSKRNVQIAIDWLDSNVPWVRRLNIHAQYKKRPNRNAHTGKQCKWTRFYPCQIVRSKGSRQTHASKQDTTESQKTNPSDTNRPHSKPKRERGSVFSPFSFSMFVPLVSAVACVINKKQNWPYFTVTSTRLWHCCKRLLAWWVGCPSWSYVRTARYESTRVCELARRPPELCKTTPRSATFVNVLKHHQAKTRLKHADHWHAVTARNACRCACAKYLDHLISST